MCYCRLLYIPMLEEAIIPMFREISPKLTINIYEYAHSFFGVDFQSNAL